MAEQTVSIEDALHAYGVVQLLKEEVVLMENEAHRLYGLADEYLAKSSISRATITDSRETYLWSELLI